MDEEKQWLDQVEKFVLEDEKIVTCKWLSQQLGVHVNVSKRLLSTFTDKSDEALGVCYLIGGVMPDGSHKVLVCRRETISKVKLLFKNVTSEHIYSIQKTDTNKDLKTALYSANSCVVPGEKISSYSAIRCEDSVIKSINEIKRNAVVDQKNKSAETGVKKNALDVKKQTNGSEKENLPKSNGTSNGFESNGAKKVESSSPKKTGLAAMFANQKAVKKPENKEKVIKPSHMNKPKGLAAFFNQGNGNKKSEKSSKTDEPIINSSVEVDKKINFPEVEKGIDDAEADESVKATKVAEKSKESLPSAGSYKNDNKSTKLKESQATRKKRKKNDKKETVQTKKRKRIVTISDSESSDEEQHERSPSPVPREATPPPPPMSDDEEIVPATPQVGKKAKRKKLVEKTFLDEDGFLVTHKEYKFESASEDEVIEDSSEKKKVETSVIQKAPEGKQKVKETKSKSQESKKNTSPQKAKQSSIMNFFGKKS